MVIKGPGAGINVTAAGVLADIVRIAKGLKQNMIINRKALT
jgi:homoserine dehydrogenase